MTSVQKKSSPGIRRKISREKDADRFITRTATQKVFPLFQAAIPLFQPVIQLSQQELPLQLDGSSQSLPRA
jgi:hypothetical protein